MVWTGKDLKKWGEGKSLLDLGGGSTRGATPSFPALLFTLSHFFLLFWMNIKLPTALCKGVLLMFLQPPITPSSAVYLTPTYTL